MKRLFLKITHKHLGIIFLLVTNLVTVSSINCQATSKQSEASRKHLSYAETIRNYFEDNEKDIYTIEHFGWNNRDSVYSLRVRLLSAEGGKLRLPSIDLERIRVDISVDSNYYTNSKYQSLILIGKTLNRLDLRACKLTNLYISESKINYLTVLESEVSKQTHISGNEIKSLIIRRECRIHNTVITNNRLLLKGEIADTEMTGEKFFVAIDTIENTKKIELVDNVISAELSRFIGSSDVAYPIVLERNNSFRNNDIEFYCQNSEIEDVVMIANVRNVGQIMFNNYLPKYLSFYNITNYQNISFLGIKYGNKTQVDLNDLDLEKVRLNLRNIRLAYIRPGPDSPDDLGFIQKTRESRMSMCAQLMEKYSNNPQGENHKIAHLGYMRIKYGTYGQSSFWQGVYYVSNKLWWNFGYSKGRIIIWTIVLFLIFYAINLRYLDYLLDNHYSFEKLKTIHNEGESPSVTCLHFTSLIFFGLKIDYSMLTLASLKWTAYIYLQYLIGVICLGFIVNLMF